MRWRFPSEATKCPHEQWSGVVSQQFLRNRYKKRASADTKRVSTLNVNEKMSHVCMNF